MTTSKSTSQIAAELLDEAAREVTRDRIREDLEQAGLPTTDDWVNEVAELIQTAYVTARWDRLTGTPSATPLPIADKLDRLADAD